MSGFSSSCLSYHSTVGAEDASSVCSSTTTLKEADICTEASTEVCNPNAPSGFPENAQPHPKQNQVLLVSCKETSIQLDSQRCHSFIINIKFSWVFGTLEVYLFILSHGLCDI